MTRPDDDARAALHARLDRYLDARRASDGGYARITPADVRDLDDLVRAIVRLKCEEDPDGDVPLEVLVVDRTLYEPVHYVPLPYGHREDADLDRICTLALLNLGVATEQLRRVFHHRERGEKRAAGRDPAQLRDLRELAVAAVRHVGSHNAPGRESRALDAVRRGFRQFEAGRDVTARIPEES